MKRIITISVIIFAILLSFRAAVFSTAASPPMTIIAENADWVFHFNLNYFLRTELGKMVFAALPEDVNRQIESMGQLTGTNLRENIDSMTIYGQGMDPQQAVAIFRGDFDHGKLINLLKTDPHYQKTEHRHRSIYRWRGLDDQTNYGTFAAHDIIMISHSRTSLIQGLEVFDGRDASAGDHSDFAYLARIPGDAFMAAFVRGLGEIAAEHGQAAVLRKAQAMIVHLTERQGELHLAGHINTGDPETARLMVNIGQGMQALAKLSPEMEKTGVAKMTEAMKFEAQNENFKIEWTYPARELADLIEEARKQASQ